jgi:AcrR family transcriptional regulator
MGRGADQKVSSKECLTPRGPGRPSRGTSPKEAIISAAIACISEMGYNEMTIEGVAERAYASKATIYRHFDGKPGLALAVAQKISEEMGSLGDTGNLANDLEEFLVSFTRVLSNRPVSQMVATLVTGSATDHEMSQKLRNDLVLPRHLEIEKRIAEAQKEGILTNKVSASIMRSCLLGSLYYRLLITGEVTGDEFARDLVTTLFSNFAPVS